MTYPENIRAAFREVALGLMEWREPPQECPLCGYVEKGWRQHVAGCHFATVYRPWDPQGEVEPFDVQADWNERS